MSWLITGTQRFTPNALLDQFPGAAAAYSLRNLVGTSNPNVVRVRRSSDNTEQDFTAAQVTDGTLTTFCGAGNGFVRTWYDQSGNSKNLEQITNASQPLIVNAGTLVTNSGKPSILYSGSALNLSASNVLTLNGLGSFSLISVTEPNQPLSINGQKSAVIFLENGTWGAVFHQPATNGLRFRFGTGQFNTDRLVSGTFANLISLTFKEASAEYAFVNGTASTLTTAALGSIANTTSTLNVGLAESYTYYTGKVSEVIVYSSSLRLNQVQIANNINAHYSIY